MTTPVNDGGPAFPPAIERWTTMDGVQHATQVCGMTLRDYFAAAALMGLLAKTDSRGHPDDFAGWSYRYADAMLAARGGAK